MSDWRPIKPNLATKHQRRLLDKWINVWWLTDWLPATSSVLFEFQKNRLTGFCVILITKRQINVHENITFSGGVTSCRRAAAKICPTPGLQRKRAGATLSQAGRAGPDQPTRAIQPAGRTRCPPTGCTRQTSDRRQTWDVRQTDVRQHHRLMPLGGGIICNSKNDRVPKSVRSRVAIAALGRNKGRISWLTFHRRSC